MSYAGRLPAARRAAPLGPGIQPGSSRISPGAGANLAAAPSPRKWGGRGKTRAATALQVSHRHTWDPSHRPGSRWQAAPAKAQPRRPPPPALEHGRCPLAWLAARWRHPSPPASQLSTAPLYTRGARHQIRSRASRGGRSSPDSNAPFGGGTCCRLRPCHFRWVV